MNKVIYNKKNSFIYSKSLQNMPFKEREKGEKWIENKAQSEKNLLD